MGAIYNTSIFNETVDTSVNDAVSLIFDKYTGIGNKMAIVEIDNNITVLSKNAKIDKRKIFKDIDWFQYFKHGITFLKLKNKELYAFDSIKNDYILKFENNSGINVIEINDRYISIMLDRAAISSYRRASFGKVRPGSSNNIYIYDIIDRKLVGRAYDVHDTLIVNSEDSDVLAWFIRNEDSYNNIKSDIILDKSGKIYTIAEYITEKTGKDVEQVTRTIKVDANTANAGLNIEIKLYRLDKILKLDEKLDFKSEV